VLAHETSLQVEAALLSALVCKSAASPYLLSAPMSTAGVKCRHHDCTQAGRRHLLWHARVSSQSGRLWFPRRALELDTFCMPDLHVLSALSYNFLQVQQPNRFNTLAMPTIAPFGSMIYGDNASEL
jgi:hypothetical protein